MLPESINLNNMSISKPILESALEGNGKLLCWYKEYSREIAKDGQGGKTTMRDNQEYWWFLTEKAIIKLVISLAEVTVDCYYRSHIIRINQKHEIVDDAGVHRSKLRQIEIFLSSIDNPIQLRRPQDNEFNQYYMIFAQLAKG